MKKLIKMPFIILKRLIKRVEYVLTVRHKLHTIYILIIIIHWIYGYAYITGSEFYNQYINTAQAQTFNKETKLESNIVPGTQEWIKQRWVESGADWEKIWAVVQGESGWNSDAWNCNGVGSSNNKKSKALDLGLYQANSQHEITPTCALNTICSTEWAINLWKEQGFTPWVAAKNLGIK